MTIDYTLTDDDGKVIDSSKDCEPPAYVQGIGNIIPARWCWWAATTRWRG